MMSKKVEDKRMQMEMVWIEKLVPRRPGRPSIDPVVLVKMVFIQYTFGIRSILQTIKEIETNVAYRWFLGFGFVQAMLVFAAMNLKKLANWHWRNTHPPVSPTENRRNNVKTPLRINSQRRFVYGLRAT